MPLMLRRRALAQNVSLRLWWTAQYFRCCAALSLALNAVYLLALALGYPPARMVMAEHPVWSIGLVLLSVASSIGWWLTGRLLLERRRLGGWLALGTMAPPIVEYLVTHHPFDAGLTVPIIGTLAVLSTWRELE